MQEILDNFLLQLDFSIFILLSIALTRVTAVLIPLKGSEHENKILNSQRRKRCHS
jgi:hypothetical protein